MQPNDPLNLAKQALDRALETERRNKSLLAAIGPAIVDTLQPVLAEILATFRSTSAEIKDSVANIRIDAPVIPEITIPPVRVEMPVINVPEPRVTVNVPDIKLPPFPEIKLPKIVVPKAEVTVKIPDIKIPDIIFPEEIQTRGWMNLVGWDKGLLTNPIPVQLRDAKGNPVTLFENLTQILNGGGGGGKSDFFTIKGFGQSAFAEIMNPDGRLKVEMPSGASGLTDTELRASAVPVSQLSGASWSVFASLDTTASLYNADNRLRVSLETGGSGLTDAELRASRVPVEQVSGAAWSVSVNDVFGSVGANVINPDNRIKVELPTGASGLTDTELRASAVPVIQVSGGSWSVFAQDALTTVTATTLVNADNRLRVSLETGGSGLTDTELRASPVQTQQVSGYSDSVNVLNTVTVTGTVTATGGGYLTDAQLRASTLDIKQVSGSIDSVAVIGTVPVSGTFFQTTQPVSVANTLDVQQVSGANWSVAVLSMPAVVVTSITNSTAAAIVDSTGVQYSGSNPIPITVVSGSLTSTKAQVGNSDGDFSAANPLPVTYAANSSASTYVVQTDRAGNPFDGDLIRSIRYQKVSMVQDVETSTTNSSVVNLGIAGVFTGTSDTTLGISAIQVVLFADQDCTISVQQSQEDPGTNWNIVDTWEYTASSTGQDSSRTIQAVASSLRVVVTNKSASTATTSFRLQTTLCPFADVLPRSLTQLGNLRVSVSEANGTTIATGIGPSDAGTLRVVNVTDSVSSVYVNNPVAQGDAATALRVVIAGNSDASVTATFAAGSTVNVNGALNSVIVVGPLEAGAVAVGAAPVQIGGVSRSTNPTPIADGSVIKSAFDDLGRQLVRPVQVRDLTVSAYATFATGTEATLLAATAGSFHDLIYILASNASTAAVGIDIRPVLAGNIIMHLEIPANGVTGVSLPVPIPQSASDTGNAWTVDLPDITGTVVHVSALFSREV